MDKTVYLLRHCQATGQEKTAELTDEGREQAMKLVQFFRERHIRHIISSPFTRTIQSVEPLADSLGLPIQKDERLAEHRLNSEKPKEWFKRIKKSIQEKKFEMTGGESISEVADKGLEALKDAPDGSVLSVHGNIMGLILQQIDGVSGFKEWIGLSHPDVYEVKVQNGNYYVKKIWK